MCSLHSHIRPNSYIFLRLPNESLKLIDIRPNTIIDGGKLGSFPANLLLGRAYYHAYELLEKREHEAYGRLRLVPPIELNAGIVADDASPSESREEPAMNGVPEDYDLFADAVSKNNRLTVDDASRQALTQHEIEDLKKSAGGREIIEKILANHAGLDEKTAFSRAKYMVRKTKKYMKRFTVLPMNLGHLIQYVLEKEPQRILEIRVEALGLITTWSNAHFSTAGMPEHGSNGQRVGGGRWLVVDETGGLVVAALAERMGILYPTNTESENEDACDIKVGQGNASHASHAQHRVDDLSIPHPDLVDVPKPSVEKPHRDFPVPVPTNSITLIHPAVQPNISLLKYFAYDANIPDPSHPIHRHLKSLSWLQLLHPEEDPTYREPERVDEDALSRWKGGKRGTYWKKRRRWERCRSIVDETREGGFDGLVVASHMDPASILPHTVPLVRGGGHVVVYAPTPEPLVQLVDLFSKERRSAYIQLLARNQNVDAADFPLDPRLLLAPTLQTSRGRQWQVLPGRTHPRMTSSGGAEGYVFSARRVIPLDGGVEARGNFASKRRKAGRAPESVTGSGSGDGSAM